MRKRGLFRRRRRFALLVLLPLCLYGAWYAGWHLWGTAQFRAAETAMHWFDYPEARRRIAGCLELWPEDSETLLFAARAASRDGDTTEANRLLSLAAKVSPEEAELERVLYRLRVGDMGDSGGMLDAVESHSNDPQSKLILEALIEGALKTSQIELADSCLSLWNRTQHEPWDTAQAAVWRGELSFVQGTADIALRDLREAVQLAPSCTKARLRLAEVLVQYGPAEGKEHLAILQKAMPDHRGVLLCLAGCHRELGEFDDATTIIDRLLLKSDSDVAALVERGRIDLDRQDPEAAERWFRKAESRAPDYREVHLGLARCLQLAGRGEEAMVYSEKVRRADERVQ